VLPVWFCSQGKFLYGSNRGHDSIVIFAIDPEIGVLTYVANEMTGGMGDASGGEILVDCDSRQSSDCCCTPHYCSSNLTAALWCCLSGTNATHDTDWLAGPRDFAISPCGSFLVVGNQDLDTVAAYSIDAETGKLTKTSELEFPAPVAVLVV
jgi:6-phosphogluconolactonase